MLRLPLLLAGFWLATHMLAWASPGLAAAPDVLRLVNQQADRPLYASLQRWLDDVPSSSVPLPSAPLSLMAAEAQALDVAGQGLRQPPPADLTAQASEAGLRLTSAARTYAGSVRAALGRS